MRVSVLGARGQLGAAVVHLARARHETVAFDHGALDVTDARAVADVLGRARPDVIVNCTGYNAVDLAEDHPVDALRLNAFAVRTLARTAESLGSVLVHYGSDFVFDGEADRPYTEDDRPNPRSAYAASKMLGEWFAADAPGSYVLRVESLFGRARGGGPAKGSVATIVAALAAGKTVPVFGDRTVSPTAVLDAARATLQLVEDRLPPGLYHCVNSGYCTWEELAREAARLLGVAPSLEVLRLADANLKAPRPRFCALSNAKLVGAGVPMPTWQEALESYVTKVRR